MKILQEADQIVTVSKALKHLFSEKFGGAIDSKILVVPNGYDEEDFKMHVETDDKKFVITYTGTISGQYDIDGFLAAIAKLEEQRQKGILFRLVGNIPSAIVDKIRRAVPLIELDLVGYVDHAMSVRYLLKSTIQLLVIPKVENNEGIVPGKFFEYLASGKPVFAIGPKGGDLEQLIGETGCGKLFDYENAADMEKMLLDILTQSFQFQSSGAKNYSRRKLACRIADMIKDGC